MATITQTLYCIQATVNGRQMPTFYLDAQVQGILNSAHAEKVARDILTGGQTTEYARVVVAAMEVNYEIAPWADAERINNG
jgi:hypothetical protein